MDFLDSLSNEQKISNLNISVYKSVVVVKALNKQR